MSNTNRLANTTPGNVTPSEPTSIQALLDRREKALRSGHLVEAMMKHAPRVTVRGQNRGNIQGFSITSKAGGVFGTQIFVRHLSTALAIKALIKARGAAELVPVDNQNENHPANVVHTAKFHAAIDTLIREDAERDRLAAKGTV